MDIISWFWHPMALYIAFLGVSFLLIVGTITGVLVLVLRGGTKPSTLPPPAGPEPVTPHPGSRLTPGQLPPVGRHALPQRLGGS